MDISYVSLGLFFLSSVFAFAAFVLKKKAADLRIVTNTRHYELLNNSVEDLITKAKSQIHVIEEKQSFGRKVFLELNKAYKKHQAIWERIEVGLLPPVFRFDDNEDLKSDIRQSHEKQFKLIKEGRATGGSTDWSWLGSKQDGASMITSYRYLMLKAFNAEFDMIRTKMRHNSFETADDKLDKLARQLENLGETTGACISDEYLNLKQDELSYWHDDLVKREDEKQERKKEQAILREQREALGNISDDDDQADDVEEQLFTCERELKKAQAKAAQIAGEELAKLALMIQQIEKEQKVLEERFSRAQSQAQITRAGYVYVISNIGSFGEDIVKIGMTRRLEPMDRVLELGDASVPFRFDVHTLAFSDDAPGIERALHNKFDEYRVNEDNLRKEFFRISPDQVKNAMEEMGLESDWFFHMEAKEYRETQLMLDALNNKTDDKLESFSLPDAI
ncbi:MAG: DUF4041 domain-containing protein [Methylophaga sp.]